MRDDLLFDEDRRLQVGVNFLEIEVFFLEFTLVVQACINALLDPASAPVDVFVDDHGRVLKFILAVLDERLGPVVSCYTSSHGGLILTFVKISL